MRTAIRVSPAAAPTCSCVVVGAPWRQRCRWISSRASSTGTCSSGDEVVLIGAQGDERITAEELAGHAETIGYEIVCGTELAVRRGRRTYVG